MVALTPAHVPGLVFGLGGLAFVVLSYLGFMPLIYRDALTVGNIALGLGLSLLGLQLLQGLANDRLKARIKALEGKG